MLTPETATKENDSSFLGIIGGTVLAFMGMLGWIWWRKQKMLAELDAESMFGNYSIMRSGDGSNPQPSFDGDFQSPGAQSGSMESNSSLLADESSFLNDFKASDFETFETFNVDHGDIDPVAEADVYLAYGRYQQAEDLMREAVKSSPERDECKLKLLEILQVSGNKDGFTNYVSELQASGKTLTAIFGTKFANLARNSA